MLITYCRRDNQAAPEVEQFISEKIKGVCLTPSSNPSHPPATDAQIWHREAAY